MAEVIYFRNRAAFLLFLGWLADSFGPDHISYPEDVINRARSFTLKADLLTRTHGRH